MLIRFAYRAATNAFAALPPLPRDDRDKDIETLTPRHQFIVLQRNVDGHRIRSEPADRALLAALLSSLPRGAMRRLQLPISPDAALRWHRARTLPPIRRPALQPVHDNPTGAPTLIRIAARRAAVFSLDIEIVRLYATVGQFGDRARSRSHPPIHITSHSAEAVLGFDSTAPEPSTFRRPAPTPPRAYACANPATPPAKVPQTFSMGSRFAATAAALTAIDSRNARSLHSRHPSGRPARRYLLQP